MDKNNLLKMNIHQQAKLIKDNQHLYTNDQLIELARNWRKDYNKYLFANLKVLADDIKK